MSHADNRVRYPDESFFAQEAELYQEAFEKATKRALRLADELDEPHGSLLRLLADCQSAGSASSDERTGASYRQLAYVAYRARMTKEQRSEWYEIVKRILLSQRHVGHLIARLDEVERGLGELAEYVAERDKPAHPEECACLDCEYSRMSESNE